MVASTTSTQDSGLFGHILPMFKAKTGIDVKVVAQGTGKALDTGAPRRRRRGVRPRQTAEEKFLAEGFGVKRYPVMYNDFVLVGPKSRSGRHQGHKGHRRRARTRSRPRAPTSSRAATSPAPIRPNSSSGRSPASTSRRTRAPGTRRSVRAWARRSTPRRRQRLCACRSRHLAVVQEPRRPRDRRSKATSGCSTSMASCW